MDRVCVYLCKHNTSNRNNNFAVYVTGFGKPTEMSHLANCTFLAQLIATLIHYPCTVAIPGLADWFAFLERILPTMSSHD